MNDEAVVADSETNTSVPSETDSSGKGVYNIYPAHDNFSDSRELRSKCSKKTFSIFQGFFSGSRQFFQTHDKFSDYLSIRICTNNIFLGAPPPIPHFANTEPFCSRGFCYEPLQAVG